MKKAIEERVLGFKEGFESEMNRIEAERRYLSVLGTLEDKRKERRNEKPKSNVSGMFVYYGF